MIISAIVNPRSTSTDSTRCGFIATRCSAACSGKTLVAITAIIYDWTRPTPPLPRNIFAINGVYCGRGVPRRTHIELHRTRGATMFEDSLVESAALLRTRNRWPAAVSITAQLCALAVILTIPLLHPEVLPMPHILSARLAPPLAPVPPPPLIHLETRA